jgi:hypothetical protein
MVELLLWTRVLDRVREISEKYLKDSQSSNDRNLSDTRDRIRAALEKTLKDLKSPGDKDTK